MNNNTDKPCIHRVFHGGEEDISLENFMVYVIQNQDVGLEIAEEILEDNEEYEYNADEPEFYEVFSVLDKEELIKQIAKENNS